MSFKKRLEGHKTNKSQDGIVYIIGTTTPSNIYKIGITRDEDTLAQRIYALELSSPMKLEVVHIIYCDDRSRLERILHTHYRPCRSHGEWFRLEDDEVEWLNSLDNIDGDTLRDDMRLAPAREIVEMSQGLRRKMRAIKITGGLSLKDFARQCVDEADAILAGRPQW